jgi:hypothetical protein
MTFAAHKSAYCIHLRIFIFSLQLYDHALARHDYMHNDLDGMVRGGFGGGLVLDDFQEPELSSLGRLVSSHHGSVSAD